MAAADSRATALRNDTAAGRRRRIRSSVLFRRPDTVRRRSAIARTTADRAPRIRRPAAADAWHPDRRHRLELPPGSVTSVPVRSPEVTSEALGRPRCRQNGGDSWRSSSSVARSGEWRVPANRDFRRVPLKSLKLRPRRLHRRRRTSSDLTDSAVTSSA